LFRSYDDIERDIDETIKELTSIRPMWDSSTGRLEPLTQVIESLDKIIITMDLPLVRKEDIHLTIEEKCLKLEAPLARCVRYERWGTHSDCEFSSFYKIVNLPARVDPDEAKAKFLNCVLSVELPKTVKGKKIKVE
jgi:HSP20 family protein